MKTRLILLALILGISLLAACLLRGAFFLSPQPRCRSIVLGDVDNDGDLDAFLANGRNEDVEPNTVWLNDGRGRFRDSSQRLGKMDSYSTALGDLDADGDLDALVGNIPSCETFENDGRGRFIAHQALSAPEDSGAPIWAVALGDLDNDSDLDAFLGGCCGATISRGRLEATPIAVLSPGITKFVVWGKLYPKSLTKEVVSWVSVPANKNS